MRGHLPHAHSPMRVTVKRVGEVDQDIDICSFFGYLFLVELGCRKDFVVHGQLSKSKHQRVFIVIAVTGDRINKTTA
jgi:hypothetical protein